jgi:hypothetical protein
MMRRSEMGEDHPQVPMPIRGSRLGPRAGAATFRGLKGEELRSIDLAGAFVLEYGDFTPLHPEGTDLDEAERRKGGYTKPILSHPREDGLSLVVKRLLLCPSKRIIVEAFVTDEGGTVPLSGPRGIRSVTSPGSGRLQWIEIDPGRAAPLVRRAIESGREWRGACGESVADLQALWDAASEQAPPRHRLRVHRGPQPYIELDGKSHDRPPVTVAYLGALIDARGGRVSFREWVKRAENEQFAGAQVNRVLDDLPTRVAAFVDRQGGRPARIKAELLDL